MKLRFGVFLIVTVAAMALCYVPATLRAQSYGSQTPEAQASAPENTWSGIYTKDQAAKGEMLYIDQCASCHGPDGAGADAPTVAGGEFASNWDGLNVGQLFDRVRDTMPQDDPQTLSREDTAALLAFMFVKNGFPPGEVPLPGDGDSLFRIKYLANKPY